MKKILLVEDMFMIWENFIEYLELSGYDVIVVINGQEGWVFLQVEQLDFVICDVKMLLLDGFEIKECVNQDDVFKDIFFIFLFVVVQKMDIVRG